MQEARIKPEIRQWKRKRTRLLVLAGQRKTGKDVFVNYVKKNYSGFRHYRIAKAPVMIARFLGLEPTRAVQQALFGVNALLRPLLGRSAYMNRVMQLLDRHRPQVALVEAIRTEEEYKEFVLRRRGILIGVKAGDYARYQRARADVKRGEEKRDEGMMTFREFLGREKPAIERVIPQIVARAHFVIENNYHTRPPFYRAIDEVMQKLGFKKKGR